MRRLGILGVLFLGVAATSACRAKPAPCANREWPALRIAVAAMTESRANDHKSFGTRTLTDLPLVKISGDGRPIPGLARTWQPAADLRSWTFTLDADLRTHDGQALTADRLRRALLDRASQPLARNRVWLDLQAIETPTPRTLVFRLARPVSVLPEALYAIEGLKLEESDLAAGPFREASNTDPEIVYEAWPPLAAGESRLAKVRANFYPSARAAWAAFLRNETDMLYEVPAAALPLMAQNPDIRFYLDNRRMGTLAFNTKTRWLRDARVRQAINLAIDREDIVRRVYGESPRLANWPAMIDGPFSPAYAMAQGITSPARYDLAAARALLDAALGSRRKPLEITCLTSTEMAEIEQIDPIIEGQLLRVQIRVRFEALPLSTLTKRLNEGDYEAFLVPVMTGRGALSPYLMWHSGGRAAGMFRESPYTGADDALDRLYTADSPEAERAAAHAVVEAMHADPPAAFLMPIPAVRAVRRTWHVPDDDADIRRTIHRWTLDPPCGGS